MRWKRRGIRMGMWRGGMHGEEARGKQIVSHGFDGQSRMRIKR